MYDSEEWLDAEINCSSVKTFIECEDLSKVCYPQINTTYSTFSSFYNEFKQSVLKLRPSARSYFNKTLNDGKAFLKEIHDKTVLCQKFQPHRITKFHFSCKT